MFISKISLPRRTVLRGLGATLALPLLDAMVPAFSPSVRTAANPVRRLGVVYLPNGMAMQYWTPKIVGSAFEITPVLQPLARYRDRLLVVSGLTQRSPGSEGGGNHAHASTKFLTGVIGRRAQAGQSGEIGAGVSMDQIAAQSLGRETQMASLELNLDARDFAGACDAGFSCAYTNTIAWRSATTPLPMENNPRVVFERLFGGDDTTDQAARRARLESDRSLLDSVTRRVADIERVLGPSDQTKLTEYLDAVRDVERRIQKAEQQSASDLPALTQPAGIPATFEAHAKLMFDLQVLAYQTDLTRVISFMLGRELSSRTYTEIGVQDAHHPLSHHEDNPVKIATMSKINTFHAQMFAYYLDRLTATPDGDGTLLDNVTILFGAGMSNSNAHAPSDLPLVLVGGGAGQLKGGRHLRFRVDTPVANLHLSILDKLGMPVEKLGDSTGKLDLLSDL
jgi:hypothetical protein